MFKSITLALFVFSTLSLFAQSKIQLDLSGEDRTDHYRTERRIDLAGVASDSKQYEATVSCIPANKNSSGIDEGYIYVLFDKANIGAMARFGFQECLDIVSGLKSFSTNLSLEWDMAQFDGVRPTKMTFKVNSL